MSNPIVSLPTPWRTVLVVCGKCARKLDGGYGDKGRDPLRTALNDALRATGTRRTVRIVEGKCFGICPKKATVVLNASRPATLLVVPRHADAATVLEQLRAAPTD